MVTELYKHLHDSLKKPRTPPLSAVTCGPSVKSAELHAGVSDSSGGKHIVHFTMLSNSALHRTADPATRIKAWSAVSTCRRTSSPCGQCTEYNRAEKILSRVKITENVP